jgi:hypothetical protein
VLGLRAVLLGRGRDVDRRDQRCWSPLPRA